MGIIATLILGGLAGWIASKIMKTDAQMGDVETGVEGEGRYRHGLVMTLQHPCTPAELADVTAPLIALAEKEHGFYMGWSTTLARESGE